MGEEAKNAKRDVPRAVLLSLAIQGCFCYFLEYFAANYFLHNGYTMPNAAASGAPIGDMMVIVGSWLFGSYAAGRAFMLVQAFTVFLALIGTTLSCLSTGARVTYAMGRDGEVGSHFGLLHDKTASPHRAIWTLAILSAVIGIVTVVVYLGGTTPTALDPKYHNIWYSFGIFQPATYAKLPNTLVIVTLVSNFGTFLLYMIDVRDHDRGVQGARLLPRLQARLHPGVRVARQPRLHALLSRRAVYRRRHELEGAVYRAGGRRALGRLRRLSTSCHRSKKSAKPIFVPAQPAAIGA